MMMKEKEGVNTRTYIQERRHLPFSNSIRRERERTIYTKLYQTEGRNKKSGYFDKILLNWLKKKKK
jgi:hypothetical protein